jgi:hypothetical protein
MVYTEIKNRNGKKYYYRVISVREGNKVGKERRYLGADLTKKALSEKEGIADKELVKIKNSTLDILKLKIIKILGEYKIKKAGIFGSYVRGEHKKGSDVDVIIEPAEGMGFEFFGLQQELQDKLRRKVDLVTYKSLHPLLKQRILDEEVRIL